MTPVTLTHSDRPTALTRHGYGDREARFLCLAALHSGYFLRRQYAEFLGSQDGGTVTQLIEKLLDKRHAEVATYKSNTHLYHLSARPFYAALGQEDNRNRRRKEPITIKAKLMSLDFVLAHQCHEYLATECEKRSFFERRLDIENQWLPVKRFAANGATRDRFFVEKYPIFCEPSGEPTGPPRVAFCYIDPGHFTISAFQTFLDHYASLLKRLPQYAVIYVAPGDRLFEKGRLLFEQFSQDLRAPNLQQTNATTEELVAYFEARHRYELKRFDSFDRAKLIQLRDAKQTFSSPQMESLYELWKAGEKLDFEQHLAPRPSHAAAGFGQFSTYHLEHSYDLFGSLTAY